MIPKGASFFQESLMTPSPQDNRAKRVSNELYSAKLVQKRRQRNGVKAFIRDIGRCPYNNHCLRESDAAQYYANSSRKKDLIGEEGA